MENQLDGSILLPDGTRLRGRGLRDPAPSGPPPDYGLYLGSSRFQRKHDAALTWPHAWIDWPDFLLPRNREKAAEALVDLHKRARSGQNVEIACYGGRGRTGTAIACVTTLTGLPAPDALAWTRTHYTRHAAETPWQRHWITWFARHF